MSPNSSEAQAALSPGTELLGEWQGSAFCEGPWIIRRADGQLIQVSRLLYQVAAAFGQTSELTQVAALVSSADGREVSTGNVADLLRRTLIPLGVATVQARSEMGSGPSPTTGPDPAGLPRANPLLALRLRCRVVPEWAHRRFTTALRPLFRPPVWMSVVVAVAAIDVVLGLHHLNRISSGLGQLVAHPALLLAMVAMSVATTAFHEVGHATAARYGGASPGVMGAGIYLAWPVFYTDVTDTYRLDRRGRLRTDLGGIYFNAIAIVVAGAAYWRTGFGPLLIYVALVHLEVFNQFLPFVRLDGYWVVSDLIGVPNLFAYVRPVTAVLLRRATAADRARLSQIKPLARRVISLWVLATTVVIGVNAAFLGLFGPRLMSASVQAAARRASSVGFDLRHLRFVPGLDNLVSLVLLGLPSLGLAYLALLLLRRALRTVRQWRLRPFAAVGVLGVCGLVASYQALSFVPSQRSVSAPGDLIATSKHAPAGAAGLMREAAAALAVGNSVTRWIGGSLPTAQAASAPPAPAVTTAPAPAPALGQAGTEVSYIVLPGDTLWSIAAQRLGDPLLWQEIWTLNRGRTEGSVTFGDPNLVWPGFVLALPAQGETVTPAPTASAPSGAAPGSSTVTPTPGSPGSSPATNLPSTSPSLSTLASAVGAMVAAASRVLGAQSHSVAQPRGQADRRPAGRGPWSVSLAVLLLALGFLTCVVISLWGRRPRAPPL